MADGVNDMDVMAAVVFLPGFWLWLMLRRKRTVPGWSPAPPVRGVYSTLLNNLKIIIFQTALAVWNILAQPKFNVQSETSIEKFAQLWRHELTNYTQWNEVEYLKNGTR